MKARVLPPFSAARQAYLITLNILSILSVGLSQDEEFLPVLSVERQGATGLQLSWPVVAGRLFLEESDLVGPEPRWESSGLTLQDIDGRSVALFDAETAARYFRLRREIGPGVFTVATHTPPNGGVDVGVTVKPQIFFSRAIDPATLTAESVVATAAGAPLDGRIVPSSDGLSARLFFDEPMPGAARVEVIIDGDVIEAEADGAKLDADGDGEPGGRYAFAFSTVNVVGLPGTTIAGVVLDTGPDMIPRTADDALPGPDGELGTDDDIHQLPIEGVGIHILGMTSPRATTASDGSFVLEGVPAGHVKIAIDGRTAIRAPEGTYFPEIVMDMVVVPGRENTVMPGMREVHLPSLPEAILHTVDSEEGATFTGDSTNAPDLSDDERSRLRIEVPAGSFVGPDGRPMDSAQIGFSTVPVDFVRDMLPPGVRQSDNTFNITFQALGVSHFTAPVAVTVPNINTLPPGTKLNFLSFDHDSGQLVVEGTGTVSADGLTVTTDPGVGITHPGWHTFDELRARSTFEFENCYGMVDDLPPDDERIDPVPVVRQRIGSLGSLEPLKGTVFLGEGDSFTIVMKNDTPLPDPEARPCEGENRRIYPLVFEVEYDMPQDMPLKESMRNLYSEELRHGVSQIDNFVFVPEGLFNPADPPETRPLYRLQEGFRDAWNKAAVSGFDGYFGKTRTRERLFVVPPGEEERFTVLPVPLRMRDLLAFRGRSALVGIEIRVRAYRVPERARFAAPTSTVLRDERAYLYRLVHLGDDDGEDLVVKLPKTLNDGPGRVVRHRRIPYVGPPGSLPRVEVLSGFEAFQISPVGRADVEFEFAFDPPGEGMFEGRFEIQTPEGVSLRPDFPYELQGKAVPKLAIYVDGAALADSLAQLASQGDPANPATPPTLLTPKDYRLIDTDEERGAIVGGVRDKVATHLIPFFPGVTIVDSPDDANVRVRFANRDEPGILGASQDGWKEDSAPTYYLYERYPELPWDGLEGVKEAFVNQSNYRTPGERAIFMMAEALNPMLDPEVTVYANGHFFVRENDVACLTGGATELINILAQSVIRELAYTWSIYSPSYFRSQPGKIRLTVNRRADAPAGSGFFDLKFKPTAEPGSESVVRLESGLDGPGTVGSDTIQGRLMTSRQIGGPENLVVREVEAGRVYEIEFVGDLEGALMNVSVGTIDTERLDSVEVETVEAGGRFRVAGDSSNTVLLGIGRFDRDGTAMFDEDQVRAIKLALSQDWDDFDFVGAFRELYVSMSVAGLLPEIISNVRIHSTTSYYPVYRSRPGDTAGRDLEVIRPGDWGDSWAEPLPETRVDGLDGEKTGRTFEFKNETSEPVNIDGVEFASAPDASNGLSLETDQALPVNLPPGESLNVTVDWDPLFPGSLNSQFQVRGGFAGGEILFPINGFAISPQGHLLAQPDTITIQNHTIGDPSEDGDTVVTLQNVSTFPVNIQEVRVETTGDGTFEITGMPADLSAMNPLAIEPRDEVEFGVRYRPSNEGTNHADIVIVSDAEATPVLTVPIEATSAGNGLFTSDLAEVFLAAAFPGSPNTPVLREKVSGTEISVFVPPGEGMRYVAFDPKTFRVASGTATTAASGGETITLVSDFQPSTQRDNDGDGLTAHAEFAIGTSDKNRDTDGDGVEDGIEIRVGTNPLDGQLTTIGIVGSVQLQGDAKAVCVEGRIGDPNAQFAYVATGDMGLAIVDIRNPNRPLVMAEMDLPGDSAGVAYDPARSLALVASGDAGVHLVDVSDPTAPISRDTLSTTFAATEVFVRNGVAYVGHGNVVTSFDVDNAVEMESLDLGNPIIDLKSGGAGIFAIDRSRTVHSVRVDRGVMEELDILENVGVGSGTLGGISVVGDLLLAAVPGTGIIASGLNTVDVSDPSNLRLISGTDNPVAARLAGHHVAGNGAGLALLGGNTVIGPVVDILNVSDPEVTDDSSLRITLNEVPNELVIADGVLLVPHGDASGTLENESGLTIVNFAEPDVNGLAPTVTLDLPNVDVDPERPGIQVAAGDAFNVTADVADDAGVRRVELLLDGRSVFVDSSIPFELWGSLPGLGVGAGETVEVRVRATDIGGNVALTDAVRIEPVGDTAPPTIVSSSLSDGGIVKAGEPLTLELLFDEPLDPASVPMDAVRLETSDATRILPRNILLDGGDRRLTATFDSLSEDTYSVSIDELVSDVSGNRIDADTVMISFSAVAFTIEWIKREGGNWFDESGWNTGTLPGPSDKVFMETDVGAVVATEFDRTVLDLFVTGGGLRVGFRDTLTINGRAQINNLDIFGGNVAGEGSLTLTGNASWTGGGTLSVAGGVLNHGIFAFTQAPRTVTTSLTNHHRLILEGGVTVNLDGGRIVNDESSVLEVQSGSIQGTGASGQVTSRGLILKTTADRLARLQVPVIVEGGSVEVQEGGLSFNHSLTLNGTTLNVAEDATLTIRSEAVVRGGEVRVAGNGNVVLSGNTASLTVPEGQILSTSMGGETFAIEGSTLEVAGTWVNTGSARWQGGVLDLTGTAINQGLLQVLGGGTLRGRIDNANRIVHDSVAGVAVDGATINNLSGATYELSRGSITDPAPVDSLFDNAGTFRVLEAATTPTMNIVFENEGEAELLGGRTRFVDFTQTAGRLRLAGGHFTGTNPLNLLGGVMEGIGEIRGNLINGATIRPGGNDAPGRLTLTGAYTQSGDGRLEIELGGPPDGAIGIDELFVSGMANLAGTLAVETILDYMPAAGSEFTILTFSSRNGDFESTTGLELDGITLEAQPGTRDYRLIGR